MVTWNVTVIRDLRVENYEGRGQYLKSIFSQRQEISAVQILGVEIKESLWKLMNMPKLK
jgi:hypothetical protein